MRQREGESPMQHCCVLVQCTYVYIHLWYACTYVPTPVVRMYICTHTCGTHVHMYPHLWYACTYVPTPVVHMYIHMYPHLWYACMCVPTPVVRMYMCTHTCGTHVCICTFMHCVVESCVSDLPQSCIYQYSCDLPPSNFV